MLSVLPVITLSVCAICARPVSVQKKMIKRNLSGKSKAVDFNKYIPVVTSRKPVIKILRWFAEGKRREKKLETMENSISKPQVLMSISKIYIMEVSIISKEVIMEGTLAWQCSRGHFCRICEETKRKYTRQDAI